MLLVVSQAKASHRRGHVAGDDHLHVLFALRCTRHDLLPGSWTTSLIAPDVIHGYIYNSVVVVKNPLSSSDARDMPGPAQRQLKAFGDPRRGLIAPFS